MFGNLTLVIYEDTSDNVSDLMWLHNLTLWEQGLESQVQQSPLIPSYRWQDFRPLCEGRKEVGNTGKNAVKKERTNKYWRNRNHDLHRNYFRVMRPIIYFSKIYNLWVKNWTKCDFPKFHTVVLNRLYSFILWETDKTKFSNLVK